MKFFWQRVSIRQIARKVARPRHPSAQPKRCGQYFCAGTEFLFRPADAAKTAGEIHRQNVTIIRMNPARGADTMEQATVLSANNSVVMHFGNRTPKPAYPTALFTTTRKPTCATATRSSPGSTIPTLPNKPANTISLSNG